MKELTIFEFQGYSLRVIEHNGEPWFIANEVCKALAVSNPRDALTRVSKHQKDDVAIADAIGRMQKTNIVSEGGLYKLVFQSRKPEAQAFTDLVVDVILPSIRKTGSYSVSVELPVYFNKQTQDRCRVNEKLLPKGYWNVESEMVSQACTLQALQKELQHWALPSGSGGKKWINHLRGINHPLLAKAKQKKLWVANAKKPMDVWVYPYALLEDFREWLRVAYADYYEHEYSPSRVIGAEQIDTSKRKRLR